MSRNDGKNFEEQTKSFFPKLFEKMGYTVLKERVQFSGTQDGFDVQFAIWDGFIERHIFIECKDWTKDVPVKHVYDKAEDLKRNYPELNKKDMQLFICPSAQFSNRRNPEKIEPELNEKFPFQIRLLDLSYKVDRLFAIDKSIYKAIYKKDPPTDIDPKHEIERFKRILDARDVWRATPIPEQHRDRYIPDIEPMAHYIRRIVLAPDSLRENAHPRPYIFGDENPKDAHLLQHLREIMSNKKTDGIVLLGNPGLGKSTELEQLAVQLWENREAEKCNPFFRPINTFLPSDEITDYLPEKWESIGRLAIVLDGLDEISYRHEFKAKLEKFITDHRGKPPVIKFVISCRTNIYENVVKDIANFKCFCLTDIQWEDAIAYLKDKFSFTASDGEVQSLSRAVQGEFVRNPYFLNLFGVYYQKTHRIPDDKVVLLNRYIEKRLDDDRSIKYKNKPYDTASLISSCKAIALAMEAMQVSKIKGEQLNHMPNSDKGIFTDCCFVDKVYGEDAWQFEHKNLQEFFAAQVLTGLDFEHIIDFIRIDSAIEKTHPAWLNAISYLINTLDKTGDNYQKLISWLKEHDPTVLFQADANRISKPVRIDVFQDFFNKRCKEETLWVNEYGIADVEFARFADCEENIDFLIAEIKEEKNHRRARISAIDLVSHMRLLARRAAVEELILKLLADPLCNADFNLKRHAIRAVKNANLHRDKGYLDAVITALGDFDYCLITSALLDLIADKNTKSEDYLDFLKVTAEKVWDDSKRKYKKEDNLLTGEAHILKDIIIQRLQGVESVLWGVEMLVDHEYDLKTQNHEVKKQIDKLTGLYSDNGDRVYERMRTWVLCRLTDMSYSYDEYGEAIALFFHQTKTADRAFGDIYQTEIAFADKSHFLAHLATPESIERIVAGYKTGQITDAEVTYFRNHIYNLNRKNFHLSKAFEDLIITETKCRFNGDLLPDKNPRPLWREFHKTEAQRNFDLLFDKKALIDKVEGYFEAIGKDEITWGDMKNNRREYNNSIEWRTEFPSTLISIIGHPLKNQGKTSRDAVIELLDSECYLIREIKARIDSSDKELTIRPEQLKYIENWCLDQISKAAFQNAYAGGLNGQRCWLLWYFGNRFDFKYPEAVLLDMLYMHEAMTNNGEDMGYKYIIKHVDRARLNKRIEENIRNGHLTDSLFEKHAAYALAHRLESVYAEIRTFILGRESRGYRVDILTDYVDKIEDISVLEELIETRSNNENLEHRKKRIVELLLKKGGDEFVIKKLLAFKKADQQAKNQSICIKYLIRANYEKAFELLNDWLKNNPSEYIRELDWELSPDDWNAHSNVKSIPALIELLKINCDSGHDFDVFLDPMRVASETLRNIARKNPPAVCLRIKAEVEACIPYFNEKHCDRFYLHTIANDVMDIYYEKKSKPMTWAETAEKIERYKHRL